MRAIRNVVFTKFALLFSAATAALALIAPMQAAALTTTAPGCGQSGPIVSGLWAGFNAATGAHAGCSTGTPTSVPPSGSGYAALGDSVAAGAGLPSNGASAVCPVSDQAYPALVAASLGQNYQTYACGGATVGDLFTEQHLSGTSQDVPPQLSRMFAASKPSRISITAGANDVYWPSYVRKCYISTCGTAADRTVVNGLITTMRAKLAYALSDIRRHSGSTLPRVVVTGYYRPLSPACAGVQTGITATEINWLNSETDALNQALSATTTAYSFVRFAPVSFSGHELCTTNPWIQGPTDPAPFHPTAAGQQVIAQAVLAKMQ
jgi:lysophospholipase L1-like esterase